MAGITQKSVRDFYLLSVSHLEAFALPFEMERTTFKRPHADMMITTIGHTDGRLRYDKHIRTHLLLSLSRSR